MEAEIAQQFDELGIEPPAEVIAKSMELCISYHIEDAVEFVEQWIAFSISHLNAAEPTVEYLKEFERKVFQAKRDKKLAAASKKKPKLPKAIANLAHLTAAEASPLAIYGVDGNDDYMADVDMGAGGGDEDVLDTYNVCHTPKEAVSPSTSKKRNAEYQIKIHRNYLLLRALQLLESSTKKEDDITVFSASWATTFRKLDANQQIFANRAIVEVLYQGQLGKLNEYSYKAFEDSNIYTPFLKTSSSFINFGTPSPITADDSVFRLQPTAHSPAHRKFTNTLPQNSCISRPQPKPVSVIPYQRRSPDVVSKSEYEETGQQPMDQNANVHDRFSDPEYTSLCTKGLLPV